MIADSARIAFQTSVNRHQTEPQNQAKVEMFIEQLRSLDSGRKGAIDSPLTQPADSQSVKRNDESIHDIALLEIVSESFGDSLGLAKRFRRAR